jgi:hypothetical protein
MIDALTHGWSGIALGYAAVQVPMIAGLMRARAQFHHYLLSPVIAAPLTAVAAAGTALSSSLLAHMGFASHGFVALTVAVGFSAALGYAGGSVPERSADENKTHRRGALVADRPPPSADKSLQSSRAAGIKLAGTAIPPHDEAKHFKLIGTTGTGKSTAIREILSGALARGDRAVIADPDAGYFNRFYRSERGDVLLNPFDQRSVRWDLFAEIKCPYDVDQLARSLIPDNEGQDRSWRGYARTFFSSVTQQAHEAGVKDINELYRLLVVADTGELRGLVRGTPAQPFLEEHNSRMFDSIRSVTSSAVGGLQYVGRQ